MANTSRREAIRLAASVAIAGLGAAAASGAVVTIPACPAGWKRRLAEYQALSLRFNEHCEEEPCPDDPTYSDWYNRNGELCEEHETALHSLLAEPVPDTEALADKIALYEREYGASTPLTYLLHDMLRFAGSRAR